MSSFQRLTRVEVESELTTTRRSETERTPRAEDDSELFDLAFRHAAIGMALVGLDGSWIRVNASLCRIVGYTSEELLQLDFQTITHPDDLDSDLALLRRLMDGEIESYDLEKRYLHKNGEVVWILLSASLVRSALGQPRFFVSQMQDITRRKRAEEEVESFHLAAQWLASLVQSTGDAVIGVDPWGHIVSWNDGAEKIYGYTAAEMLGRTNDVLIPEGRPNDVRDALIAAAPGGATYQFDTQRRRKDGALIDIHLTAAPVPNADGKVNGWSIISRDVTEQKRNSGRLAQQNSELKRTKLLLESTFANIRDGVALLGADRRILLANAAYEEMLGLPPGHAKGLTRDEFTEHVIGLVADPIAARALLAPSPGSSEEHTADLLFARPSRCWIRRTIAALGDESDRLYLVVWRDVTAERDLIAEREREVLTDVLTGIPNRRAAEAALRREVARVTRGNTTSCVVLIDIDHFKRVNDHYGHAAGDEVLRRVARVLTSQARGTDVVARWGGEEFIGIVAGDLAGATAFCERARRAIANETLPTVGHITVSMGLSQCMVGQSAAEVVVRADAALYEAKRAGRDRVVTRG